MIALYKYILEVNAKEEEELFQLKDNADTKANSIINLACRNRGGKLGRCQASLLAG